MRKRKILTSILCMSMIATSVLCTACGSSAVSESTESDSSDAESTESAQTSQGDDAWAAIDMSAWNYNESEGVFWQVGISYCQNPANEEYETLGIYVPEAYFTGEENDDGTYTCSINEEGQIGDYTAANAPVVLPVNTPGYSAMAAPTGYSDEVTSYTQEGFIYVYAGCRGRESGAPAGVTDLKAAIRYVRANADSLPGDYDSLFSFGMSGGGAQSALLGTTGDSELYTPYLEEIGAVMDCSDAVKGSMCWCPITNLDVADAAYEWNMGVTRSSLSTEEQSISDGLAEAFASYINELKLTDENSSTLLLEASEDGIYQAGSYYDYIKDTIETSLENFIADTSWPYDASSTDTQGGMMGNHGGMPDGEKPDGDMADGEKPVRDMKDGEKPDGDITEGEKPDGEIADGEKPADMTQENDDITSKDNITRDDNTSESAISLSGTYDSPEDYIAALNAENEWVSYDAASGEVSISDIASFVKAFKSTSKSLGAFDQLDRGQGENELFGYGDGEGKHFDSILSQLLTDLGAEEAADYEEDLSQTDALGTSVSSRVDMYNPMYYLCDYYQGKGTSTVAPYFRIRTGINQSDTSLCTEVNLALALQAAGTDVDFATVWGQGHTEAERSGDSTTNFIQWVKECMN